MANPVVKQVLQQQAVDIAFTRHVSDLFDRFVASLKTEKNYNRDNSHARSVLVEDYGYARLAHQEMSDYIATQ